MWLSSWTMGYSGMIKSHSPGRGLAGAREEAPWQGSCGRRGGEQGRDGLENQADQQDRTKSAVT